MIDQAIAPLIGITVKLLPVDRAPILRLLNRLQTVQRVVIIILRKGVAARDIDFLLLQITVIVGHGSRAVAPTAHTPAIVAVMIDDRTAIPRGISRSRVAGALTYLRQLPARVVEALVENRSARAVLLFSNPTKR